ncbi:MAG: hypothetical protein V4658_14840, partial [Bacteroidota bacterium]
CYSGVFIKGQGNDPYYDTGLEIGTSGGNTISNYGGGSLPAFGIYVERQTSFRAENNNVSAGSADVEINGIYHNSTNGTSVIGSNIISGLSSSTSYTFGIRQNSSGSASITKNKIFDLTSSSTMNATLYGITSGILIQTGSAAISNNLVGNLNATLANDNAVNGICLSGSSPVTLYHNTVYLSCSTGGTVNFISNALYTNTTTNLDLRNNIFYNASTYGFGRAYGRSNTTLSSYASTSNNNLFFARNTIYAESGATYPLSAFFKTRVSPREQQSIQATVAFVSLSGSSPDFLKADSSVQSAVESRGAVIAGFTDAYNGTNLRTGYPLSAQNNGFGTAPDIGAYEIDGKSYALTGVLNVGAGKDCATLAGAIDVLNNCPIPAAGVTVNIDAGHTETFLSQTCGVINTTGTAQAPIMFRRSGSGANPLIRAASGGGNRDGIILINGGDYITFDAIDLQENPLNTTIALQMDFGYGILKPNATNACKFITIKNCNVSLTRSNTLSKGIHSVYHGAFDEAQYAITSTSGLHSNINITGNTVSNCSIGISMNGPDDPVYRDLMVVVDSNTVLDFGSTGIFMQYAESPTVQKNTVKSTTSVNALMGIALFRCSGNTAISGNQVYELVSPAYIYGIAHNGGTGVTYFSRNKIYDLTGTGASSEIYGINGGFTVNTNITNNVIGGLKAPSSVSGYAITGIYITNATSTIIYHNTIHIASATGGGAAFGSSCIYVHPDAQLDLRNNILYNASTFGSVRAVFRGNITATYLNTSNNNLYYCGNAPGKKIYFTDYTTGYPVTLFKALSAPRDNNSLSAALIFLSTTGSSADYLRVDPAIASAIESRGMPISGYTDAYNGTGIRASYPLSGQVNGFGTAPDIGAYESDGIAIVIPGNVTVGSGKDYPTVEAVFDILNNFGPPSTGVTVNVEAGHTETFSDPLAGFVIASGSASSFMLIRKSGSGANPLITASAGTGKLDGIVTINGGDYITFDGIDLRENLSNANTTTQMEWGYGILKSNETNGSKNITIRNCSITLNKADTGSRGIYSANHNFFSSTGLIISNVNGTHANLGFYSNTISNCYTGIFINGYNNATYYDTGLEIGVQGGNTISNFGGSSFAAYGIYLENQAGAKIENNAVSSGTVTSAILRGISYNSGNGAISISGNTVSELSSTGGTLHGIFQGAAAGANLMKNNVYNLSSSNAASTVNGIYINAGSTINASNNIVGSLRADSSTNAHAVNGLYINGGTAVNVYYNTVYLACAPVATGFGSNAIYAVTAPVVNLRNNIFYNASASGIVRVYSRSNTLINNYATTSNNNLFYAGIPSATNLVYFDGTNADQAMATFKTRMATRDQQSVSASLSFLNTSGNSGNFLRVDSSSRSWAESRGVAIAGVSDAYNGAGVRTGYPLAGQSNGFGTAPDIGAYEFDGKGYALATAMGVGSGKEYPTISMAIEVLNNSTVPSGGATFNIDAGHTETLSGSTAGLITATGTSSNPVVFKKSGTGANPQVVAAAGTTTDRDGIIIIGGGDYITFDGIDLKENTLNANPNMQMEWGYGILKGSAADGAQNITIRNCAITLSKTYTNSKGIYSANHTPYSTTSLSINSTAGINQNLKFSENIIDSCNSGIWVSGSSNATYYDSGLEIGTAGGNIIRNFGESGSSQSGIFMQYQASPKVQNNAISSGLATSSLPIYGIQNAQGSGTALISGNKISAVSTSGSATGSVYAIYQASGATANISRNKIYDLSSLNTAGVVHGIYINNGSTVNVSNNLVGNLHAPVATNAHAVNGLYVNGGTVNSYYNTVHLACSAGGIGFGSNAVYAVTSASLDLRNNIFYNVSAYGTARAYTRSGTSLSSYSSASNNNLFFAGTPSVNNLVFSDLSTSDQQIAAFRTRMTPRDKQSVSDSLVFFSTSGSAVDFLRLDTALRSQVESGGIAISGYTDSYDSTGIRAGYPLNGQINGYGTAPDIGAYEYDGKGLLPLTGNTISPAQQVICSGSAPGTLTGSMPSGGTGAYAYSWLSSNASAATGFTAAPGIKNEKDYTPAALTQNTWYKRVINSGLNTDTSAVLVIMVDTIITANSISSLPSVCPGSTLPITGSVPKGGNRSTYNYTWLKSLTSDTAGFYVAGSNDSTQNYTPMPLGQPAWFRRVVISGVCAKDTSAAIKISLDPIYSRNNPKTICNGASYVFNAHTYTTAGTYRDTLHTIKGCDSIIVTELTVNPSYSVNNAQTICNGGSYVFNTHTYTTAGTYRDTLHTIK